MHHISREEFSHLYRIILTYKCSAVLQHNKVDEDDDECLLCDVLCPRILCYRLLSPCERTLTAPADADAASHKWHE